MNNKTKDKYHRKYLIISDVHSNLEALKAVIEDAVNNHGGFNRLLCLGDLVGYGPNPRECIELLRKYDHLCVCGNHDMAASGETSTAHFNGYAADANRWNAEKLTDEDRKYLANLPQVIVEGDFTLVHGCPREPVWEYIDDHRDDAENFNLLQTPYCLVGHTHRPAWFASCDDGFESIVAVEKHICNDVPMKLNGSKLIINPGSVGQPRDGNPRAGYATYDTATGNISYCRVSYDIKKTQEKMRAAGLPGWLSDRLAIGN